MRGEGLLGEVTISCNKLKVNNSNNDNNYFEKAMTRSLEIRFWLELENERSLQLVISTMQVLKNSLVYTALGDPKHMAWAAISSASELRKIPILYYFKKDLSREMQLLHTRKGKRITFAKHYG